MRKQTDISQQIRKYLNGELDARAMHLLEKEAQNDPFVADALEGYEKAGTEQQSNLDELQQRLQQRTQPKVRRMIPWKAISAAASVIVVLTIGSLWLNRDKVQTEDIAMVVADKVEVVKPAPPLASEEKEGRTGAENDIVSSPKPAANANKMVRFRKSRPIVQSEVIPGGISADAMNEIAADSNFKVAESKASTLEDKIVEGYFAAPAQSAKNFYSAVPPDTVEQKLAGRIAGMNVAKASKKMGYSSLFNGSVVDAGVPLAGARVRVMGTPITAITDLNGRFSIPMEPKRLVLDVDMIGYLNKQVKVNKKDSLVIAMQPYNQSLSEVVVVGYGTKKKEIVPAMPANGWDAYNKYLAENAVSPDGKTGTVKLTFIVNPDNTLSDIKITRSLSKPADDEAIKLIKEGPAWEHNSSGRSELVKVSIKFTPKE